MNRWFSRLTLALLGVVILPHICPAPIIYRPGEGWTYEPVGSEGRWMRNRAKDQLQVAKDAFAQENYKLATKAARRVTKVWPLSDYAGEAQYLVGRCYEARKQDDRAFKEYQKALTRYPKVASFDDTLNRQFEIANRYLAGQWFRLWTYIPIGRSMDRTAKLFESIARNGPYHQTGPKAQMSVGEAREKQKNYPAAVKAYERAADRYNDRPEVAADAIYKAGLAYNKQAKTAEYDQSVAGNAIATFKDFQALYPKDKRGAEADVIINSLRTEQARGAFETAKFYEEKHRYQGAVVYYNEVVSRDPNSPFAAEARERITALQPRADAQARARAEAERRLREREKAMRALQDTKPQTSQENVAPMEPK